MGDYIRAEWKMLLTEECARVSSARGILFWRKCHRFKRITEINGPQILKDRLWWRRLSQEERCCLWTWMMKSCLRLWILTSSSDITHNTWGNLKAQCLDLLKDWLGSLSLKLFVNNNRNTNKYGLMICISPSSVMSFAFFIAFELEHTLSFLLTHTIGILKPFDMFSRDVVSVKQNWTRQQKNHNTRLIITFNVQS